MNWGAIVAVLHSASALTVGQLDGLSDAWRPNHAAFDDAWFEARRYGRLTDWHEVWRDSWEATRSPVLEWAGNATQALCWEGARAATRDACLALLMRDILTEGQFDDLARPWVSVMGPLQEDS